VNLVLGDFREEHAEAVAGWVQSAEEALGWASVPFLRLRPAVLAEWHAEPGVVPCVGLLDGTLCAYGQVWEDRDEDEAELAKVIVAPDLRGRGIGRAFVALLADEARRRGFPEVMLRVARGNRAAFACYQGAGFVRVSPQEEAAFNDDQPQHYVWMRLET